MTEGKPGYAHGGLITNKSIMDRKKIILGGTDEQWKKFLETHFPYEKEKSLAPKNHVQEGIIKYRRESWREGFYVSVLIDAALRHIHEFYWKGKDWDASSTELGIEKHHLAGALFSLLSILHTLDTRPELDDRFCKTKEKPLSMEGKDFFLEMEEE